MNRQEIEQKMEIFHDPKLKLKRANKHIGELDLVLRRYCSGLDPARIYEDRNSRLHSLQFKVPDLFPSEVPLILGDAIHNLRCALDIMTCEQVTLAGGTPTKRTQFPFGDSRDKLINSLKKDRVITATCPVFYDLIVDTIKPYLGGNDALCALHELDITDKHKLLDSRRFCGCICRR